MVKNKGYKEKINNSIKYEINKFIYIQTTRNTIFLNQVHNHATKNRGYRHKSNHGHYYENHGHRFFLPGGVISAIINKNILKIEFVSYISFKLTAAARLELYSAHSHQSAIAES